MTKRHRLLAWVWVSVLALAGWWLLLVLSAPRADPAPHARTHDVDLPPDPAPRAPVPVPLEVDKQLLWDTPPFEPDVATWFDVSVDDGDWQVVAASVAALASPGTLTWTAPIRLTLGEHRVAVRTCNPTGCSPRGATATITITED